MIEATLIDNMGDDLSVVSAARVSFGKKSDWVCSGCKGTNLNANYHYDKYCSDCGFGDALSLSDKDAKLIKYLAEHKHYSPFGHCFASFHIKAPIFVARQLVKHKFLRWNEISRRYVDDTPEFYVPDVWRGKAKNKKQGSEGEVVLGSYIVDRTYEGDFGGFEGEVYDLDSYYDISVDMYNGLLGQGVCPEQARMVLPTSQLTEWFWSGSLDAFADMCKLRLKDDTQHETRLVAQQIDKVMESLYTVSWKALVHG